MTVKIFSFPDHVGIGDRNAWGGGIVEIKDQLTGCETGAGHAKKLHIKNCRLAGVRE
jgi:DNA-binding helix-hairpin-helix protein with protein kinase domain